MSASSTNTVFNERKGEQSELKSRECRDVPVQRDTRKEKFASKQMPLYKEEMVLGVQRGVGMVDGEEWRQFALPIQQFLVQFQHGSVIRRPNCEC